MFRRYRYPSMWREIDQLQREMSRMNDRYWAGQTRNPVSFPAMNIWTNEENALLSAEVPGVDPKGIEISVVGGSLTITGSRMPEEVTDNARYHRQERGYGNFSRNIELPFNVDASKVEATFKDGVLNVVLPRAEADKPKKIKVRTA